MVTAREAFGRLEPPMIPKALLLGHPGPTDILARETPMNKADQYLAHVSTGVGLPLVQHQMVEAAHPMCSRFPLGCHDESCPPYWL